MYEVTKANDAKNMIVNILNFFDGNRVMVIRMIKPSIVSWKSVAKNHEWTKHCKKKFKI
jgi:hypothetical protein